MKYYIKNMLFSSSFLFFILYFLSIFYNYYFDIQNISNQLQNNSIKDLATNSIEGLKKISIQLTNDEKLILKSAKNSIEKYFNKYLKNADNNIIKEKENNRFTDNTEMIEIKKILKIYDFSLPNNENFDCIKTSKILVKTTVCIHDITKDIFVSRALKLQGVWEIDSVKLLMKMLNSSSKINFLDIGANLGQYALFAAMLGRKCVAVEPFYDNIRRIHKSAQIENISDKIILVTNGISDIRGEINKLTKDETNVGGQKLIKIKNYNSSNLE